MSCSIVLPTLKVHCQEHGVAVRSRLLASIILTWWSSENCPFLSFSKGKIMKSSKMALRKGTSHIILTRNRTFLKSTFFGKSSYGCRAINNCLGANTFLSDFIFLALNIGAISYMYKFFIERNCNLVKTRPAGQYIWQAYWIVNIIGAMYLQWGGDNTGRHRL